MADEDFIRKALELAEKAVSWTSPNPLVGAVIVKSGQIIAVGYHKKFGANHAEIEALKKAKGKTKGATLYLNLEPCCHFGKTPPCTEAIIKAGIKRVVCSTLDPNPKVGGEGITKLKQARIETMVGLLEKDAQKLNEAFFTVHQKKRPFIAIKFASSLDGKIATKTGDSKWITNEEARSYARHLRGYYQAILVGVNTVIKDNPHLGVRDKSKKDPLRIIMDPSLKIPIDSLVLRDSNVLIITTSKHSREKLILLQQKGVEVLVFSGDKISIPKLLSHLKERGVISILVEGGGKTVGYFIDSGLVDKVYAFFSPLVIGGEDALGAVRGKGFSKIKEALYLKETSYKALQDNYLISGYTSLPV